MNARIAALLVLAFAGCGRRDARTVEDASVALPDARNACGGDAILDALPGTACGTCGLLECAGTESLVCAGDVVDACGRCGTPPEEWCNGRDDDCDGLVDERCILGLDPLRSSAAKARLDGERVVVLARNAATDWQIWTHRLGEGEGHFIAAQDERPERADASMELDGAYVVWSRAEEVPFGATRDFDVFVADLDGSEPPRRIDGEHPVQDAWVDIDDGRAAFSTGDRIVIHDLRTGAETVHAVPGTPLDLGGHWVLAGDARWGARPGRTLTLLDVRDGAQRALVVPPDRIAGDLAIDGEVAVFVTTALDGSRPELAVIELATMRERALPLDEALTDLEVHDGLVCGSAGGAVVLDLASGRSVRVGEHAIGCDVSERTLLFIDSWRGEPRLRYLLDDEP